MKTKIMNQVLMVAGAAALVSMASAQLSNVTAATHAGSAVSAFPAPAMPAPSPGISTGAGAGSSAAAAGGMQAPIAPPSAAAGHGQGRAAADVSASPAGVNAGAVTHASGQGQANGLSVATGANDRAGASLRTDETVRTIHDTGFAARDRMTADVQARIDASDKVMADLKVRADAAGDKAHAAFAKALANVRKQERQVRADLRAAKGTSESSWGSVQSELAKSYGAYAHAVAEAEVAAQGSADTSSK